jgi:hypothetical protein
MAQVLSKKSDGADAFQFVLGSPRKARCPNFAACPIACCGAIEPQPALATLAGWVERMLPHSTIAAALDC